MWLNESFHTSAHNTGGGTRWGTGGGAVAPSSEKVLHVTFFNVLHIFCHY